MTALDVLTFRIAYLEAELERANSLAAVDHLTGLFNRRVFDDQLKKAFSRAARSHHILSLLMLDIDHFKTLNDSKGHQAGDIALKKVAHKLVGQLRSGDHVYRYGGEEFAILLSNTPVAVATQVAERVRKSVKTTGVTISVGVASSNSVNSALDLVDTADRALYRAKQDGRNRVAIAD